MFPLAE
jgi:uncharacterized membrane protein YfcA